MAGGSDSFADAVVDRFAGGTPAPAAEPDGDETMREDAEAGRMLAAAIKRGDGAAICEAVRRIVGV